MSPSSEADRSGTSVNGGVGVAVPAAGLGRRMGGRKKAFLELRGRPVLQHALEPFLALSEVRSVAVALPSDEMEAAADWTQELDPRIRCVPGGRTRLHSVLAALEALEGTVNQGDDPGSVLVHDGARPLVTTEIIRRCLRVVRRGEGAVAGWPVVDTLKRVDDGRMVVDTPDRGHLWRAQTPQAFPYRRLLEAYREAARSGIRATDDASVFTHSGGRVRMVEGSPWNLKVTHPADVPIAEFLLARREGSLVGEGGAGSR